MKNSKAHTHKGGLADFIKEALKGNPKVSNFSWAVKDPDGECYLIPLGKCPELDKVVIEWGVSDDD